MWALNMRARFILAVMAAGLSFQVPAANAYQENPSHVEQERAVDALPVQDLVIETKAGDAHCFQVELAQSSAERARGLMFRKAMPDDAGMLFDYGSETMIAMWMKNTFIELDMLFIDSQGVIRRIHRDATPHDLSTIPSMTPVQAVLEVNGGMAERLGIAEGDRVRHEVFGNPKPCNGA